MKLNKNLFYLYALEKVQNKIIEAEDNQIKSCLSKKEKTAEELNSI
jgi:hypothetical protein